MEQIMESIENKIESPSNDPVKKGTILIMEDQRGFRRIYRDVLEQDGYEVLEGADGEEGWELIITRKPDLVLLDLGLPLIGRVPGSRENSPK